LNRGVDAVPSKDPEDELPRMTLGQHLDELRRRVVRAVLALVAGTILAFVFHGAIFDVAVEPYRAAIREVGGEGTLQAIGPLDAFTQSFKLAFIVAAVVVSPFVLWQLWGFVAAGLYPHEKRAVRVFFPVSVGLFAAGCAIVWTLILPIGIRFLIAFGRNLGVTTNYAIEPYLSLCLALLFGMGLAFQLPLVMLFLQAVSIVSRETFAKGWRIAVFSAFVLSMILTPDPTPVSQVLMATPLVGLYFLGVWGGRFVGARRERLTLLRAWPLALTVAILVALFLWGRALGDAVSRWFSG
jgi:sec-independent protein translocase protein TatC